MNLSIKTNNIIQVGFEHLTISQEKDIYLLQKWSVLNNGSDAGKRLTSFFSVSIKQFLIFQTQSLGISDASQHLH